MCYDDANDMFEETSIMDFNFECAVKHRFGPDVEHICNFYKSDGVHKLLAEHPVPDVFVDVALVGDGSVVNSESIGVYTTGGSDSVKYFWAIYEKYKERS